VSVSYQGAQLLQLHDYLVPSHSREALIGGRERAVELRTSHRVEEVGVLGGHLLPKNREILAPTLDFIAVEGGGGLG
jgi:hypothetical protein